MAEIKIQVSGASGSGKSAVIQLMMEALHAKGLSVQFINPEHPMRDAERLQTVIDNIKDNTIVFEEVYGTIT